MSYEDDERAERREVEEREYRAAQETAREIVTLIKMVEAEGSDVDEGILIRGVVREKMHGFMPRQSWQLVEVLAWAVADAFDGGLEEWSEHILKALATDEQT